MSQYTGQSYTGQVLWFNDLKKFGFIKISTPDGNSETEIFVHQTGIAPTTTTNKATLYTGEYVLFELEDNGVDNITGQSLKKAVNVRGIIYPHTLLCEHGEIKFHQYSKIAFKKNKETGTTDDQADSGDCCAMKTTNDGENVTGAEYVCSLEGGTCQEQQDNHI